MKISLILCVFCLSVNAFAQADLPDLYRYTVDTESRPATLIAQMANLRGTPSTTGNIVVRLSKGEMLKVYAKKGPWYLVQASSDVGWLHGNVIEIHEIPLESTTKTRPTTPRALPPDTYVPPESAIQGTYTGSNLPPEIEIHNDSDRRFTVTIGGAVYYLDSKAKRTISIEPGIYDYEGAAANTIPTKGRHRFAKGYIYSWRFYIVRR